MEALLNTIIKAFGWSIFHSLWQGALIYGLLFLILMTRTGLSAKLKHNLAFGAICLMFFSFVLTFLSILKLPSGSLSINFAQQLQTASNPEAITTPLSFSSVAERYFPYVVALYAVGLLIQLAAIFTGYRKLEQLKNSIHHAVPEEWDLRFRQVIAQLKISKVVAFYLSDQVNVPLVIGFFKPVILFPISLSTQLDLQQVEAILIHELSHIRRNDHLLNLIKTGIETILFFNPFVWLSSGFVRIEREHDCDDLVVQITGTPLSYAHTLLKIELIKNKETPALSLAASGSSQHLYQRIKRITDMKTTYMNAKQRIFAVTLTLATIISLAWISPAKEKAKVKTAAAEMVNKVQQFALSNTSQNPDHLKSALPIDSPEKKKKIKIITVDEKGNRKAYSSFREVPDSLKEDSNHFYLKGMELPMMDSTHMGALLSNAKAFAETFNTPEQQAKWQKLSLKMEKDAKLFEQKFNAPKEHAKWEKLGKEMELRLRPLAEKMNSPEEQAKWKNLTDSLERLSIVINKRLNSPEFKEDLRRINSRLKLNSNQLRVMVPGPPGAAAPAEPKRPYGVENFTDMKLEMKFNLESPESAALKNSAAYKKLQKEFDQKVEKLKKKQEKNK